MNNGVSIIVACAVLSLSGCHLFWQEPPAGNIVDNTETIQKNDTGSIINSFIMACLENNVSGKIQIFTDSKSRKNALHAIAEAGKIVPVGVDFSGKSSWILKSSVSDNGGWILQLHHEKKLIWSSK